MPRISYSSSDCIFIWYILSLNSNHKINLKQKNNKKYKQIPFHIFSNIFIYMIISVILWWLLDDHNRKIAIPGILFLTKLFVFIHFFTDFTIFHNFVWWWWRENQTSNLFIGKEKNSIGFIGWGLEALYLGENTLRLRWRWRWDFILGFRVIERFLGITVCNQDQITRRLKPDHYCY